jgi:hypothetical protein
MVQIVNGIIRQRVKVRRRCRDLLTLIGVE